jgi:hypothetical protein
MKRPFYKWPYNYDSAQESDLHTVKDFGPSLTIQSQTEDADLNVLMHRYGITGKMPENPSIPFYSDFDEVMDFSSAQAAVLRAQESFMEYPADLRARFQNNPQLFLEYCAKPENLPEMRKLGLAKALQDAPQGGAATPVAPPPTPTTT